MQKKVCPSGRFTERYTHEFTMITYCTHYISYINDCVKITNSSFEMTAFIIASFRFNTDKFF